MPLESRETLAISLGFLLHFLVRSMSVCHSAYHVSKLHLLETRILSSRMKLEGDDGIETGIIHTHMYRSAVLADLAACNRY